MGKKYRLNKLIAFILSVTMVLKGMAPVSAAENNITSNETEIATDIEAQNNIQSDTMTETEIENETEPTESEIEPQTKTENETESTESEIELQIETENETESTESEIEPQTETENETELTEFEIETQAQTEISVNDDLPLLPVVELDNDDIFAGMGGDISVLSEEDFPAQYNNSVNFTTVKDQNPWGTCWTFSTMALIENSLIEKGLATADSIDLSERHLAYFANHTGHDSLGTASDDYVETTGTYYLDKGGNVHMAATKLMNWHGAAYESDYPYENVIQDIDSSHAQDMRATVNNIFFIPTKNVSLDDKKKAIKSLIMEYGGVEWSYLHFGSYYNSDTGAYFCNDYTQTNHSITVVGWDDNYSRDNFKSSQDLPENNGAWIVRNSWGRDYGDNGYIYISYEDTTLGSGNDAAVIVADTAAEYDNNYFHSNTSYAGSLSGTINKISHVYKISGDAGVENLEAVSFMIGTDNVNYSIQLYKNPDTVDGVIINPESGIPLLSTPVTGSIGYAGLYTVDIPGDIKVSRDSYVSIVISFDNDVKVYIDQSSPDGDIAHYNVTQAGESFYGHDTYWIDTNSSSRSLRINLMTTNNTDTVTTPTILSINPTYPQSFNDTLAYKLRWVRCGQATGYNIYRSENDTSGFVKIATVDATENTYTDLLTYSQWNSPYYYKVEAVFDTGNSESNAYKASVESVLRPKVNDIVTTRDTVTLNWTEMEGAVGYRIERKGYTDASYEQIADLKGSCTYTDDISSLTQGRLQYRIQAYVDSAHCSDWSNISESAAFYVEQLDYHTLHFDCSYVTEGEYIKVICEELDVEVTIDNESISREATIDYAYESRNFEPCRKYTYRVEAYDESWELVYRSNDLIYYTIPDELSGLTADFTDGEATFNWTGTSGADTITVYKAFNSQEKPDNAYQTIEADALTFKDIKFNDIGDYYYWFVPSHTVDGEVIVGQETMYTLHISNLPKIIRFDINSVDGTDGGSFSNLKIGNIAKLTAVYIGTGQDNVTVSSWSVTDTNVASIETNGQDSMQATLTIFNAGTATIKAVLSTGDVIEQDIDIKFLPVEGIRTVNNYETYIQIKWDKHGGANKYAIYRSNSSTESGVFLTDALSAQDTYYNDKNIITGKTYYYKVQAISTDGKESNLNDTISVKGQALPSAPSVKSIYFDKVIISNNPDYEYAAIAMDESYTEGAYISGSNSTLTIDQLIPNTDYRIYARTKKEITGEASVYSSAVNISTPIEASLVLSEQNIVLSSGNSIAIGYSIEPENTHVSGELRWLAYTPDDTLYQMVSQNSYNIVKGSDGKEILRFTDNMIYATGESDDKVVKIVAQKGSLQAECIVQINVPVNQISIMGKVTSLKLGDSVNVSVSYLPANADDRAVLWSTSDSNIVSVETTKNGTVLTAVGIGSCTIKASTADGVNDTFVVSVQTDKKVKGIWISDEDITSHKVIHNNDGTVTLEGYGTPRYSLGYRETKQVNAYLLTDGASDIVKLGTTGDITWVSANSRVASVTDTGVITGYYAGETDIYAYDNYGNNVYGKVRVVVHGLEAPQKPKGISTNIRFSPVVKSLTLEGYSINSTSKCNLQIMNSEQTICASSLFTYTSSNSKVCIVDSLGIVRPNPTFVGGKGTAKITATHNVYNKKIVFNVTVVNKPQISRIDLYQVTDGNVSAADDKIAQRFNKGDVLTFLAKAYDTQGNLIDKPKLAWSITDTSLYSIKTGKDGTVTVTGKKAGRANLVCTAKDNWKRISAIQIASLSDDIIVSAKQVTLNSMSVTDTSQSFGIYAQHNATLGEPKIAYVRKGKEELDKSKFAITSQYNGLFAISVDSTYVDTVKNNTTYVVGVNTTVNGIPEIGDSTVVEKSFEIKLKIIVKKPSVTVKEAKSINRFYKDNQSTMLTIKTEKVVSNIQLADAYNNNFDKLFKVRLENGKWYLDYQHDYAKQIQYNSKNIKGALEITLDGNDPITVNLTVQTPYKSLKLKQLSLPSINISSDLDSSVELELYNQTHKQMLEHYIVIPKVSEKLEFFENSDKTCQMSTKDGVSYKNNETVRATVEIMGTDASGKELWQQPIVLKVQMKVLTSKPAIQIKNSSLTLNKKAKTDTSITTLWASQDNVKILPSDEWQLSVSWLELNYDEQTSKLTADFAEGYAYSVKPGAHKVTISNVIEGYENVSRTLTVKVIDKKPSAKISVKGQMDKTTLSTSNITGYIKGSNITAKVRSAKIIDSKDFSIRLLDNCTSFKLSPLKSANYYKKGKTTLTIRLTYEDNTAIDAKMSFVIKQSIPRLNISAMQTIYKSTVNLTKDYNMSTNLKKGVMIDHIEVVSLPNGIQAITNQKKGHVLVTLNDRGKKPGIYQIKVKVYFVGAKDNPVSKTIKVKVQ